MIGAMSRERVSDGDWSDIMHTVIIIAVGLGLLGLCVLVGRFLGGTSGAARGALVFVPLWFLGAGFNMYVGVRRAGYSVAEETPILLIVFAIPAAAALYYWWNVR
jgi:hypothetical protein